MLLTVIDSFMLGATIVRDGQGFELEGSDSARISSGTSALGMFSIENVPKVSASLKSYVIY